MAVRICSNLPLSLTGSLIHYDFISVSSCFGERKQITIYYEINRPLEQILQVYDHSEKFQSNRLAPIEGYYDVNVTIRLFFSAGIRSEDPRLEHGLTGEILL